MPTFQNPAQFREYVYAFQPARIILSAYELDLFSRIGRLNLSSAAIAEAAGTDPRATDRLLNALVAIGLLEKKDGCFANEAFARRYLDKASADYLTGYGHTLNMWQTWSGLTEAVTRGTCRERVEEKDTNWTANFIAAMDERARVQADDVVRLIGVKEPGRLLDIGGGSGVYSLAFLRQGKARTAVILDLPEVIAETKGYVERAGFSDNVHYISGNYHEQDLGEFYDLIFLSAIVHINSYDENRRLIERCARALNPGGRVIIQDHVMDDDRTNPVNGAFFALNMLVATERGDTYTEQEMREWMQAAGLGDIQKIPVTNNAMIIGTNVR